MIHKGNATKDGRCWYFTKYKNGINHTSKKYLTKEECAKAEDLGNFYRVPADNRGLNYDKYFTDGNKKAVTIEEFNSNNARRLNKKEIKETMMKLTYIKERLDEE